MDAQQYVYSASQIETFRDCKRKWGLDKINGYPRPSGASAKLGQAIHTQLETYLKGGQFDFDSHRVAADIASGAVQYLPVPNAPGLIVEGDDFSACTLGDNDACMWTGRIDWLQTLENLLTIGDHKSTSDIALWGKTADDLQTDVQAIIYARYGFEVRPDLHEISLQWTYMQTRGARVVKPVYATLTRPHVLSEFAKIEATANEISIVRSTVSDGMDLPPTPETCDKYGGCPYRDRCNINPFGEFNMSNTSAVSGPSLMDTIQRLSDAQRAAPAIAAGPVTHAANGKILPPDIVQKQYMTVPGVNPPAYRQLTHPLSDETNAMLNWYADGYAASQPPPAPPPAQPIAPPAPAWVPPGQPVPPAWQPGAPAMTGPINPPEFQPIPVQPPAGAFNPPAPPAPPTEAPKRRGRPPKALTAGIQGPAPVPPTIPAPPPVFTAPPVAAPVADTVTADQAVDALYTLTQYLEHVIRGV